MIDDELREMIRYLKIRGLEERWDELIAYGEKKKLSHVNFLRHLVKLLHEERVVYAHQMRIVRAAIPEKLIMATYPFAKQPKLDRSRIMNIHDSLDYMKKTQNIILVGPTGVGKSGLAIGFLLNAIDHGYTGCFITFPALLSKLQKAIALHDEERVLKNFAAIDCIAIDEVGYVEVEAAQVGLFFRLMSLRHKKKTTIVTSNLGFQQWGDFLKNAHLTAALVERLTSNSHVIHMKNCVSINPKPLSEN
jgi:DNA replication protein DnaC